MAKTLQFDDFSQRQNPNCVACEEMLADVIDGVLSPADLAFFDTHLAGCTTCMDRLAEAQRGAAWLEMLKSTPPQPSPALMERILAQTAGLEIAPAPIPYPVNVLPFVPRPELSRFTRFTRLAMEPRLAMTAAMAFFSIALTMNLTGVRFDQLHAADLKPSNIKRTFYEAKASAVRYSDNLRVVRVVEARVDDMRQDNADDQAPARTSAPAPETQPSQPAQQPAPQPQDQKKQDIPQGSSRRESPLPATPKFLPVNDSNTPDRLRLTPSVAALSLSKEGGLA